MTLLEFARGPGLQWSVAIFLFGLLWRLVGIFFLRTKADLSAPRNPAKWKGLLDKLLVAPSKITKTKHHKALPYADLPQFMTALQAQDGFGARALEFLILTACRSGEVRGATWEEIDLRKRVWTIPGERMKMGEEHRVPLSDAAVDLIKRMKAVRTFSCIFPLSNVPDFRRSKRARK